ncbi:hypothetical protein CCACVL1_05347 [Corchorus capsularis]|uniref:Uncharacterized protein n=1 Tax=Corchorus capsularis TaxID=210143 RepID=A0A1R3JLC2_COCAP|nr:hypothetical protein CCACVL1_05347 [Corchorus capsularis]
MDCRSIPIQTSALGGNMNPIDLAIVVFGREALHAMYPVSNYYRIIL